MKQSFFARPGRWANLTAAIVLALFVLALYARLLFTNRVLAGGDILLYFYPYRDFAAQALRDGTLPLWNPYIFMGAPFLANPQAAVLYPLHWPLIWLPVTAQIYWSAALHTWLLGFGAWLLLRRLGGGTVAALVTGLVLAGCGFYGGMIGHLNQMNSAAWLPWALLVVTRASAEGRTRRQLMGDGLVFALLVALMLLAGHTQTTYINLFGVALWLLWLALGPGITRTGSRVRLEWRRIRWQPVAVYVGGSVLGALLCAPQLLPTLELSANGLRSGGLSWAEATSFSLKPLALLWTLLPTYGLVSLEARFDTPAWSEFVAYVGLAGLLLALLGAWRGRGPARALGLLFAAAGLFLALGRWNPVYALLYWLVPGFDLFRTPARWMMLYVTGAALLSGLGAQVFLAGLRARRSPAARMMAVFLVLLVGVELLLAARALPHTAPTAPQAVYDLRTAPAHLATDPARTSLGPAAAGRFLGMSTITFDPGDMADTRRVLRDESPAQLSEQAFADLIIAQKVQELLVPNLPMLWRIPAVDGYDGGVLPLQRYNLLAALLAPRSELTADGRLREQISTMPPAELLALLDARYVVTDKVRDLWFEGIYYDRQVGVTLRPQSNRARVDSPENFEATHIDLIAALERDAPGLSALAETTRTVLSLSVQADAAAPAFFQVAAGGLPGAPLADGALDSPMAQKSGAVVALRDVDAAAQEYRVRLALPAPMNPSAINLTLDDATLPVTVQAVTLLDERTGMFQALLPSDSGALQLVHSGDVKVYENRAAAGRVWLSYATVPAASPQEAAGLLGVRVRGLAEEPPPEGGGSSLASVAVVEGDVTLEGARRLPGDGAEVVSYAPERVEVRARTETGALLVLADAWYPGWQATVDGAPAEIYPTNLLFRGVVLPPGEHTVLFTFAPDSWRRGLWIGTGAALLWIILALYGLIPMRRAARSAV